MRNIFKIILLIDLLLLTGCGSFQQSNHQQHLEEDVQNITKTIEKSAQNINDSSQTIDDKVVIIKQTSKDIDNNALMSEIAKNADAIVLESNKLKQVSLDLSKVGVKLEISGRVIDDYANRAANAEQKNAKLEEENTKLKEDMQKGLNKILKWVVAGCLIGAGICAAMALFSGNVQGGLIGGSACLIIMVLAIAVSQYIIYIAIGGVVAILGTFGLLGYQLFIQRKAIADNVWTQEVVKTQLPLNLKEKIYGARGEKGQAGIIQSKSTQKIVQQIKKNLPIGWKITKENTNQEDIST